MKKLVYIMHIEWGWIKQRPHFILENLDEDFNTVVFFQTMYKKFARYAHISNKIKIYRLFNLPLKSFGLIYSLDKAIISCFFKLFIILRKPSILILSHPEQIDYVRDINIPIIYDCMDLHIAMADKELVRKRIQYLERELLERAEGVVFSSEKLYNLYGGYNKNSIVIPNGIKKSLIEFAEQNTHPFVALAHKEILIIYNGVVTNRIDFEVLEYITNRYKNVKFEFIGPIMGSPPNIERVSYLGSMEHEEMLNYSQKSDAFIMPHIINDMVLSMDPVKMYEYIALGKPVLSVYYPELDKFAEFIEFYNNKNDIDFFIENLINGEIHTISKEKRLDFLRESTWKARSKKFLKFIKEII